MTTGRASQYRWVLGFVLFGLVVWVRQEFYRVGGTEMVSWQKNLTSDCAVVLTGGPKRLTEGVDLLSRKSIEKLIVVGVNPEVDLQDIFPHLDFFSSANPARITLEKQSMTTFGNAQVTRRLALELGCKDLLLVTSRLHMYRALRTFRAAFPQDFAIHPWPVPGTNVESSLWEQWTETCKSLAYSVLFYWRNPVVFR